MKGHTWLATLAIATVAGCGGERTSDPSQAAATVEAGAARIDVAQLKSDLESGRVPLLIDVRTPAEFRTGHVPGARNIPLDELEQGLSELAADKQKPVYVICEVGGRSASAARMLAAGGFQPKDVAGGTRAWRAAGYPLE